MPLIEDITDKVEEEEKAKTATAVATATSAVNPATSAPAKTPPPSSSSSPPPNAHDSTSSTLPLPSAERVLDAFEIERIAKSPHIITRPTARLHLTSLVTKLRREAEALQRMEKSRQLTQEGELGEVETKANPSTAATANAKPSDISTSSSLSTVSSMYVPIDKFAFDAGGYNSPFVTLYIDLPNVGANVPRDQITCTFQPNAFDLIVRNYTSTDSTFPRSYRLVKDNLEKNIDPEKSKIVVKVHKILIKLHKVKSSEYGSSYDYWTQLSAKKSKVASSNNKEGGGSSSSNNKEDPQQSIMQLMKDMYDEGDDNMRKIIGETMLKQRTGELNKSDPMKDFDSDFGSTKSKDKKKGRGTGALKDDFDYDDFDD